MRIVFVLPDLPLSGAATRTVHLVEHLVSEGNRVLVVTFLRTIDSSIEERLLRSGVYVVRLLTIRGVWSVRGWILGERHAIIHSAMPTAGLLGLFLARMSRRPIVYSYTNCLHTQQPLGSRSILDHVKSRLERFLASRCDALHAVSDSVAAQLLRAYPDAASRVHAIPYRVTHPASGATTREPRRRLDGDDAWPHLLYAGRLSEHKRVEDVIRAVAAIRGEWPKVRLVVLGSGPQRRRLAIVAADVGVADRVVFAGETSDPARLFEWADVLVHPSLYEGYPRVFAEAIAMRIPVVSIDAPYARELAEGGASIFLARPMDSGSLGATLTEALRDVGSTAHRGYAADVSLCSLCKLYARLATRGAPGPGLRLHEFPDRR